MGRFGTICTAVCDRCDGSPSGRLCRLEPAWALLKNLGEREFLFCVDPTGNSGKTYLAKYFLAAGIVYMAYFTNTSSNDVIFAFNGQGIVIFDSVRVNA